MEWVRVHPRLRVCRRRGTGTVVRILLRYNKSRALEEEEEEDEEEDEELLEGVHDDYFVEHTLDDKEETTTTFPTSIDEFGCHALAHFFLDPTKVSVLSQSSILRELARDAFPWRLVLRHLWRGCHDSTQPMTDLLRRDDVSDEFLRLGNAHDLLRQAGRCDALEWRALAVLRRLQPASATHSASWRASALHDFAIARVWALPVTKRCFRRLVGLGLFDRHPYVTEHALLYDDPQRSVRALLLPENVNSADIHVGVASLLQRDEEEGEEDDRSNRVNPLYADEIRLHFGELHSEMCLGSACHSDEWLQRYEMDVEASQEPSTSSSSPQSLPALVLRAKKDRVRADKACSIDELPLQRVQCDPLRRTRHETVRRSFPLLVSRLEQYPMNDDAACLLLRMCAWECQARRLVSEWTLEGIDTGGNVSSLGSAILFVLGAGWWAGASVRLYLSPVRTAAVQVRMHDGSWQLVQPCQTAHNVFTLMHSTTVSRSPAPCVKMYIEVRAYRLWYVAIILQIVRDKSAKIRFLETGEVARINLHAHAWRPLANSHPESNIERVLRKMRHISLEEEAHD